MFRRRRFSGSFVRFRGVFLLLRGRLERGSFISLGLFGVRDEECLVFLLTCLNIESCCLVFLWC